LIPENTILDGKTSLEKSDVPSQTSSDTPLKKTEPVSNGVPKTILPKEVLAPFHDPELLHDLNDTDSEQSRLLHGFFAVLGLCHTALAVEPEPGLIEYKAQSPDEAALVQAAADVGFVFRGRDRNIMRLNTPFSDTPDEYELLHVLEFNSTRKRMSVILRKMDEDNRLFLLCKGADNVIFERLADGNDENKKKTDADLQYFAGEGLRTLCLGYRVLEGQSFTAGEIFYALFTAVNDL
jgi:phospholipid-translocating ATPase